MGKIHAMVKLPNAGLGNRLLPWARARVFCRLHGVPFLEPTWTQLKLGPLLRGERDLRLYRGLFQRAPDDIRGVGKLSLLAFRPRLPEPERLEVPVEGRGIVVFSGFDRFFTPVLRHHELLREELHRVMRPEWVRAADGVGEIPIAIHARRGDFGQHVTGNDWFVLALRAARERLGRDTPAVLFTDGRPEELASLLAEPRVRLAYTGSALSDLWALSKAKFLLGSGGSTFSGWASFLGRMTTWIAPQHDYEFLGLTRAAGIDWSHFHLPSDEKRSA